MMRISAMIETIWIEVSRFEGFFYDAKLKWLYTALNIVKGLKGAKNDFWI
jgi:hypothetical protein